MSTRRPTSQRLVSRELTDESKPVAFVLAGHNGSGKSTLWYQRLADGLKLPLVNADRLTMSILPEPSGVPARVPEGASGRQLRVEGG